MVREFTDSLTSQSAESGGTVDKDEIRRIRHKLGWSQEKFAQSLNVSWVSVNRWESGKNEPKPETVAKIRELEYKGGQ